MLCEDTPNIAGHMHVPTLISTVCGYGNIAIRLMMSASGKPPEPFHSDLSKKLLCCPVMKIQSSNHSSGFRKAF